MFPKPGHTVVDPDLFPQLSADQTETLDTVEALENINVRISLFFFLFRLGGGAEKRTMASSLPLPNILRTCAYSVDGEDQRLPFCQRGYIARMFRFFFFNASYLDRLP
jgi:hypothetical protein